MFWYYNACIYLKTCFHNVLKTAERSILDRPCTKIQYKFKHTSSQYEMDEDSLIPQNVARFILYFSSGLMEVREQYIIFDAVAMVSAIGGTLGLCIG